MCAPSESAPHPPTRPLAQRECTAPTYSPTRPPTYPKPGGLAGHHASFRLPGLLSHDTLYIKQYFLLLPLTASYQELTVHGVLKLGKHASSRGSLLAVGIGGSVSPADPATLSLAASSVTAYGPLDADQLSCRGAAEIEGKLSVAGDVTIHKGELKLGEGGMDARDSRIRNAYLEDTGFVGAVKGDVVVDGGVQVGGLKGEGEGRVVVVGSGGKLKDAPGVKFDEEAGVFVVGKMSGHEVSLVD